MIPERLLAKSTPKELVSVESVYLPNHLEDVHAAAVEIVKSTGKNQLATFGLDESKWLTRFERIVTFASAIHDVGKANDHFQAMLQPASLPHRTGLRQGLRHEWVSVLIAWNSEMPYSLRSWLRPAFRDERDFLVALWAVSGHHPRYGRSSPPRSHIEGTGAEMQLLLGHPDFRATLSWLGQIFNLGDPPKTESRRLPLVGPQNAFEGILQFYEESDNHWQTAMRSREKDQQQFVRFVAAVKNCVVAADIAGSSLAIGVAEPEARSSWVRKGFQSKPTPKEITQLMADRLKVKPSEVDGSLRGFQREVGESTDRITFAKAGCGSGKTLAAYEWARKQCPGQRLFVCYPTTGTATEGFRDYLLEPEPGEDGKRTTKSGARLFHSRQQIDLEILDVREPADVDDVDSATETAVRVASLEVWSTPIAVGTCDVVLGVVQNNRRGVYSWPALSGAAFVFDEIHAYDDRLFGALLRFLTSLRGTKVLLMTASLPAARRKALDACLSRIGEKLVEVPGPEDLEVLPRYHQEQCGPESLLERTGLEVKKGKKDPMLGKVLRVCNTVDRAMAAYAEALEAGLPAIVYHSRFRYHDRVTKHQQVIEAFKGSDPVVAICTQVAEMSLDLSASLLITDLAPVPALIQRLGRLNRCAEPARKGQRPPKTMPFVVVEPLTDNGVSFHLPYTPEDFEFARKWLELLPSERISQRHLAETWESLPTVAERRPAMVASAWLDGGPVTRVLEVREGTPGVTVILREDVQRVRSGERMGNFTIPMPPPPTWFRERLFSPNSERLRGCFVVNGDMIQYEPERGAQWRKSDQ